MPIIEFSDKDFLRGKIVTPAWYLVHIDSVLVKPAKGNNPQTTELYPVEGTIVCNAENGSTEYAGVPTPASWSFNDNPNARGFILGFLKAVTGDPDFSAKRAELKAAEGQDVEIYIKNDEYEGRIVNKIDNQYRPTKEKRGA